MKRAAAPRRIDPLVEDLRRRNEDRQFRHEVDHVAAEIFQGHRGPPLVVAPPCSDALARPLGGNEPRENRLSRTRFDEANDRRQDAAQPRRSPFCIFGEHALHVDAKMDAMPAERAKAQPAAFDRRVRSLGADVVRRGRQGQGRSQDGGGTGSGPPPTASIDGGSARASARPARPRPYRSLPLLSTNGATSATPGGFSAPKGAGRQTASAESPTRAVRSPLSTPSPSRAESFEARPWPTICCNRLSPTAIPPVIATCAATERASLKKPSRPGRPP